MRTLKIILSVPFIAWLLLAASTSAANFDDGRDAFLSGDYAQARREWTPLAESGDTRAMVALGRMYLYGWGVAEDLDAARQQFEGAAKRSLDVASTRALDGRIRRI